MDASSESPTYEIKSVVEQEPFKDLTALDFLEKWCEVNDSIKPRYIRRKEWDQKTEILSEKDPDDGKRNLYIPFNIRLWEMVAVMEVVDNDTFKERPEKRDLGKKEIVELGKTLKNAGIYIATRLDSIYQGKEIASAMAEEFYGYGKALIERKKEENPTIEKIATEVLTEEETEIVDKFLAGEKLYESRKQRIKDGNVEAERRRTLNQFFAISERAFELRKKGINGEASESRAGFKPWQDNTPFYNAFIKKVEGSIKREIEKPKREITDSIFRRGMELLGRNMPFDKLPAYVKENYLHWEEGETTLREALHIDRLKADLENTRYFGSIERISAKEREIADWIQLVVSKYTYEIKNYNPTAMIARQTLNCVGASTLGGTLMQEAGLNYLVGDVPEHSILFLVTSDGRVEWRDMLSNWYNEDLTDEIIVGKKKDGSAITVNDIVEFSKKPNSEGLIFDIEGYGYRDKMRWVKKGQRQYVTVFGPEYGQKIQILNTFGSILKDNGDYFQAEEVYREAIALSPKYGYPYNGLGNVLTRIGRNAEAIEMFRKAIEINPKNNTPYYNLGNVLEIIGRHDEAIETSQKFIELADKEKDQEWIDAAESSIARIKISEGVR